MTKEEYLIRELCRELAAKGVHTDRFTELWLESGVNLDSCEFEIANKILQRYEETEKKLVKSHTVH